MDDEQKTQLQKSLAAFRIPRYRELPDFGLRLEQVAKYVSRYVPAPVTGSMVSNYVKQKIIPGPEKKNYGVDAIAYLIIVSYLKNAVSLEDAKLLLEFQQSSYQLSRAYDYFCQELETLLRFVSGLGPAPAPLDKDANFQKELLRTALYSITYKIYLEYRIGLLREAGQGNTL